MIGRLTGRVVECSPGSVLLDVAGVGYALQVPLSTFYALTECPDGPVSLHVHTYVREDALQLFGFATGEERQAFEHLIAISGVGPRTALAVLSGIGVPELERAVREGDREKLERIPGIGRKTAERVLFELRDRLERGSARQGRGKDGAPGVAGRDGATARGVRSDAISALVNLGYGREIAARAVTAALEGVDEREVTLETALKAALRSLIR